MSTEVNQTEEKKSNSIWGMFIAWAFVIALLAVVGIQLLKVQQGTVRAGESAPDFNLISFDGEELILSEMAGKVVLINFWASWCLPCEAEAAELQAAWEYYRERGDVIFIGIDYSDTETKALEFLQKYGVTYPNAPDLGTRVSQAYRMRGVPETFIIDQKGIISYVKIGAFDTTSQIIDQIDPLLEP